MKEMHLETIRRVKNYIYQKDYDGLKNYIELRQAEVASFKDDKSSEYIDNLIKDLKK